MAEKRNGVLIIKGFTLGAVKDFLNFLYTGTVTDEEHALEMFALASTYNVQPLRSICKKIIMDYLDDSNALEIYILGHLYLCDDLILAVLEEIEEFWWFLLKSCIYDEPEVVSEIIEAKRKWKQNFQM